MDKKQRHLIVHILTDGKMGGAQRTVQWLAKYFDQNNFEYHFIFLYSGGIVYDLIKNMGYPVYNLHWPNGTSIMGRYDLFSLLRSLKPDLVHDHDDTPISRVIIRAAVKCPLVSSQHSGGLFLELNRNSIKDLFIRIDDRATTLVLANSQYTADIYRKQSGRPASGIRVVYLGLDLRLYDDNLKDLEKEENCFNIIFVGRVEIYKGVMQLPELANILEQKGIKDFKIKIVGDGAARAPCCALAAHLGVSDYFQYLGWQDKVPAILHSGAVVVFPSLLNESFGLVPLEALAAGLSVIAYAGGGVGEVLDGAPNAYIVPKGDINALADKVIQVYIRRKEKHLENGLAYVRARFDIRNTAAQIEQIYRGYLEV